MSRRAPAPGKSAKKPRLGARFAAFAWRAAAFAGSYKGEDVFALASGLSLAGASVWFAGYMLAHTPKEPQVFGMEYLGIFAKPSGGSREVAAAHPIEAPVASTGNSSVDYSITGSISARPAPPPSLSPDAPIQVIGGDGDLLWVQRGASIVAVHPGDNLPGLGRVSAIELRKGRWTMIGGDGQPMGDKDGARKDPQRPNLERFSRRFIFADE